ncbi:hypothetical protein EB796_001857 [Bugula neritina]|uniref:Uncharacterized protein n=1 Tax=Bugula neritina TaxID=10212 RepID=A0A7J7KNS2_BUGNE|nr:hypothetical protein EB796_001857 [Bugula neritina]
MVGQAVRICHLHQDTPTTCSTVTSPLPAPSVSYSAYQQVLEENQRLYERLADQLKTTNGKLTSKCQEFWATRNQLEKTKDQLALCEGRLVSAHNELSGCREKDDSSGEMSHLQDRVSNLEKQNADLINNLASANKIANEERVRAEREAEKAEIERVKCGEIRDRSSQERVLMDADRRRLEKFERTNRDLLTEKQKVDQTNVQLQEVHNMLHRLNKVFIGHFCISTLLIEQCRYTFTSEEKDAELESVKKENDRLNKELQKSMAEVNQLKSGGGNLTNYLTEQLESLREENRRLSSQLKEAIDELAEHKKASQPCLKSASDTVAKGSKPLLPPNPVGSAAFVPSAPDVTATPNQQTQDYAKLAVREANLVTQVSELEAKVVELNQKLSDLNVVKGKELGDLNRLIDECADDKLQTARRDKSVINLKLSASEAQKTAADVAKLNDQISRLEEELSFLKERDEVADGEETKDSQISSLRYELQLAKKDIESYHKYSVLYCMLIGYLSVSLDTIGYLDVFLFTIGYLYVFLYAIGYLSVFLYTIGYLNVFLYAIGYLYGYLNIFWYIIGNLVLTKF